jgi:hypothetical protein
MKNVCRSSALIAATLLSACGGEPPADGTETETSASVPAAATATVAIDSPNEGEVVMTGAVTVRLSVEGMQIVPAGDMTSGTGHHHLYLDADLTAQADPVPTVPGSIIHMGDGSAVYTFEGVAPGEHRLIAVVADGIHIPLNPSVVDTVMFTVNN